MTPERWQRLKELFQLALERAPGERGAFLDQACAGDPELRREVEALLEGHAEAGDFLESGPFQAAAAGPMLEAGALLGPYQIVALLGAGGMGEVYRARDTRLGRDVAVKVLLRELAWSAERRSQFEQEAHAASALNHPHILAAFDVGWHEELPYLVTELLEGQTLAARLDQGPVPVRKAVEWVAQAARGLAAAHDRGIVHRDLTPVNLFVTSGGAVKVLDFGLAKLDREAATPPPAGSGAADPARSLPMGTVGFMSPEQVRGEPVDFRSDQFSLGCVLYLLLGARAPFQRPTAAQTLAAVLEDEPAPLLELNRRVPAPLAWIVERCLAKEPDDRYAATGDLARDLELALGRMADPAGAAVEVQPGRGWRRVALALGGVVLLTAATAAVLLGRTDPQAAVPVVRYLTFSGRDSSPSSSSDGRTIAFSSRRDGRHGIWLMLLATGSEFPLTEGDDDHPRFSPDGSTVLFSRSAGARVALFRVPSIGGAPRRLVEDALYGDFSADGRRICFVRHLAGTGSVTSVLFTAAPDGSDLRELARFEGRTLIPPRWSPDGRYVAVSLTGLPAGQGTVIGLVDVETGGTRTIAPPPPGHSPGGLAWVGARRLAYTQPDSILGWATGTSSRIVIQDLDAEAPHTVLSSPLSALGLDVVAPDRLVFESGSSRVNLQEIDLRPGASERHRRWLTRGNSSDRQPVYTRDGAWVVFSSNRSGNLDLWAVSRDTGAVRRITDDAAQDWDPGFTPDGKLVWSTDRTGHFEIWMAEADGTSARQVTHDGVDAENPGATPDGRWIVYASSNPRSHGIMKVHPDGTEPTLLVAGNLVLPEVSPDGRFVAFVADLGSERALLRVAHVADGAPVDFEISLPPLVPAADPDVGRCRWLPDGRGLAFLGREPDGTYGVYLQEFAPGQRQAAARHRLLALEPDSAAESLGISPDGAHLTVGYWDQLFNLVRADRVPGISRPPAAGAGSPAAR